MAGNVQGCGDLYISGPFFNREGGNSSQDAQVTVLNGIYRVSRGNGDTDFCHKFVALQFLHTDIPVIDPEFDPRHKSILSHSRFLAIFIGEHLTVYILPTVPEIPLHDVHVTRLSTTAMNVSFTRLSIVEAKSVNVVYTVMYASRKNPVPDTVAVPDGQSNVVITGLDPDSEYSVTVVVSANGYSVTSANLTAPVLLGNLFTFWYH